MRERAGRIQHLGPHRWSIEGAIGSKHKVDASYLSPNVNMAARLETATKQYGVAVLMSGDFVALLSPAMRARCRPLDVVLVKGSRQPMAIWTVDLETGDIAPDEAPKWQEAQYVHSSATPAAGFASSAAEFEGHPDVRASYSASDAFIQAWKVRQSSQAWRVVT